MTKKDQLLSIAMTPESFLNLEMQLPYSVDGSVAETIVVPPEYIFEKLTYVAQMYNDNLEMSANPAVKILNFYLS